MIARFNGNVVPFADDSTSTNRTVFGGTTQSDAIDDNLNADFKKGWEIVGLNDNPTREDFNAMGYTLGALTAYLYEMGISEWNASQNYRVNSIVMASNGNLYKSLTGTTGTPNVGNNPLSDVVNWKSLEAVFLTGNQTIAGIKTFSSNIVGNITGNAATATNAASAAKWTNARTITLGGNLSGSVSIDGSANVTLSAQVNDDSHKHTGLSGTVSFYGSTGNSFANSNIEVRGNGNTVKPGIGFHQPGLYAGTLEMLDVGTFQFKTEAGQLATVAKSPNDSGVKTALNASGNAPIYACRAWVNFNGTGTVAIRASGNVSSITDNGVGFYTINFTTAMPDANYSEIVGSGIVSTPTPAPTPAAARCFCTGNRLSTSIAVAISNNDNDIGFDMEVVTVAIFR